MEINFSQQSMAISEEEMKRRKKEKNYIQIKKIFRNLKISKKFPKKEDITESFINKNADKIGCINNYYTYLDEFSIALVLKAIKRKNKFSVEEIISIFNIVNSVLQHLGYFFFLNERSKEQNLGDSLINLRDYNNTHFESFLIKNSQYEYFFIDYLIYHPNPIDEFTIKDKIYKNMKGNEKMEMMEKIRQRKIEIQNKFCEFVNKGQRRELKLDVKMFWNYICYMCPILEKNENKKETPENGEIIDPHHKCGFAFNCPFAHNENELMFHPICYKKLRCPHINECKANGKNALKSCPYYHSLDELKNNFVNFEEEQFALNLKDLFKRKLFSFNSTLLPTEFNIDTYKMNPCPLGSLCKLDEKECLNYHSEQDKRRPYILYEAKKCPEAFSKNPLCKCLDGDKCNKCHNIYEYFYHPDIFRKKTKCPGEIKEGFCKYYLVCPFIHKEDKILNKFDLKDDEEKSVDDLEDETPGLTEKYNFLTKEVIVNKNLVEGYYKTKFNKCKAEQDLEIKDINDQMQSFICPKCLAINMLNERSFALIDNKGKKNIPNAEDENENICIPVCKTCELKIRQEIEVPVEFKEVELPK
ncbi:MAG: hypothetical protein MJ252_20335 [archaeon]|nr:hypothetical protein [archaeon]